MKKKFSNFSIEITKTCPTKINLKIHLKKSDKSTHVSFLAAKKPDLIQSYTGSSLPFPDGIVALQNTTNKGSFTTDKKDFSINLDYPNAYYSYLGTRIILPHVKLEIKNRYFKETVIVELNEIAPFRLLSYQSNPVPRADPHFYKRPVEKKTRSQEEILRMSGYRLTTPHNFWGGRIPNP